MAASKNLAKGLLEKEEIFLQEIKRKLMEQLNRLKIEELALQSILANDNSNTLQQSQQSLVPLNNTNMASVNMHSPDDVSALNEVPLENLNPHYLLGMNMDFEEHEETP